MMRRRAQILALTLLWPIAARAQDAEPDDEPPPCCSQPASAPCCAQPSNGSCCAPATAVLAPSAPIPTVPHALLLKVAVGPVYRRALKEDFGAAGAELEVGGQTAHFSVGARMSLAVGATRVGLPFEFFTVGPGFMFTVGSRLRLGVGSTFGQMILQRVSATAARDPNIWAWTAGVYGDSTVDLVRTRGGGAFLVGARVGYDFIENVPADLATGSSLALTAWLGYRY
jgi:hypothetical protein